MMLKKLVALLLALMITSSLAVTAGAWDERMIEGIFAYNTNLGYVTIADVDKGASGDVVVPSILGGFEVKRLGYGSFSTPHEITSVVISDGIYMIDERVFIYCTKLKSVTIPDSVRIIGNDAFLGCESLTEITIPDSVTTIGRMAFANIPNLERVVIYDSVSSIGEHAFLESPNVTIYGYPGTYAEEYAETNGIPFSPLEDAPEELDKVRQTEGIYTYSTVNGNAIITGIDDSASGDIEIPDSLGGYPVIEISANAFAGKGNITEVVIPEGVSHIGEYAFYSCPDLQSVTIPSTLTLINNSAFQNCEKLKNVEINEGVKYIGASAFSYCVRIMDLVLPSTIEVIGQSAFEGCGHIYELEIPENVRKIGAIAFRGCHELTNIKMSKNLTRIGRAAFDGCGYNTNPLIMNVYSRTLAHRYAHNEGIRYARLDEMIGGDVNQNGSLNLADISDALKVIAKWNIGLNGELVDVNADGNVNLSDVTLMLKAIAGWKDIYLY